VLSQIDLDASIQARRYTTNRGLTVAIDQIVFHKPVHVDGCLLFSATTQRTRLTSISI
jgi:acyl-CoA hydrolase